MHIHRITGALAALVVAGALVSCAADVESDVSAARDGKGRAAHQDRGESKAVKEQRKARPGQAKPGKGSGHEGGSSPAAPGESAAVGSTGAQGTGPAEDKPKDDKPAQDKPADRPSCTDDPSGDLESSGGAPSYADVTGGCLRAVAQQLILEARTVGAVPARMPDGDTQLSYGFALTTPAGSTIHVDAQASPDGWSAYVSRDGTQREIDPPTVDGNRVVLSLPLAELGGAERVHWALEASWLKSGLLQTEYAFDSAPDSGAVRFKP